MSTSSESAEQLVRLCLDETEFALKITGSAVKNIIAALYAISKDTSKSSGKARLSKMLRSEKELKIFSIKSNEMKIFAREAKSYGVLYCALVNKKHKDVDGMIDIMVRAEDAGKVNRIIERFKLNTVNKGDIKSEIEKELAKDNKNAKQAEDLSNNTPNIDVETKDIDDNMIDDIFSKPLKKEENQVPLESQMEKSPQLEHSSTSKNNSEGAIKPLEKKSVRKELKEIAENQKEKEELKKSQKERNTINQEPIEIKDRINTKSTKGKEMSK